MSRTLANLIVAIAGVVTLATLMINEPSADGVVVVVLATAVIAAAAVVWSRWGDPQSRNTRAVAFFVLLVGGFVLFAQVFVDRVPREIVTTIRDGATLREVTTAIRAEVASSGAFPTDLRETLRRNHFPQDQLHSAMHWDAHSEAAPTFEVLDSEAGFFRLGDFIWVYADLNPTDWEAHVIAFDIALDRRARVVVYGDARHEIVYPDEFTVIIAEENRRRAERGLKPISKEITQIAAEKN